MFQGTGISLYSAKGPGGGQMNVTCDWKSTVVPLNNSVLLPSDMVWHVTGLDSSVLHVLKVEAMGDGRTNIDWVDVIPDVQSALPPAVPDPLPPCKFTCII